MTITLTVLLVAGSFWCASMIWLGVFIILSGRASESKKRFDYIFGSALTVGASIALGLHIWKFVQLIRWTP